MNSQRENRRPKKTPAFSARAVSAVLTRAGLERKSKAPGTRQVAGDFYLLDFVEHLPALEKGPRRVEVHVGGRAGGGDLAGHRDAIVALVAAGYDVEEKLAPPGYGRTGTIWVVGPVTVDDRASEEIAETGTNRATLEENDV